jgi:hypothetical protein
MRHYLDTEFIEGFHKPIFGKRRHFIDLISIGIVAEDGRTYYAISNEFDPEDADEWVKENVLYPIIRDSGLYSRNLQNLHGVTSYDKSAMRYIQKKQGKSNAQIAQEIIEFIYPIKQMANYYHVGTGDNPEIIDWQTLKISDKKGRLPFTIFDPELKPEFNAFKPEFYAYYADYDWVVFCSLFGRMIDLPPGFPMYCRDLKQLLDEKLSSVVVTERDYAPFSDRQRRLNDLLGTTLDDLLGIVEKRKDYPKQQNGHNALDDARWNKSLHEFIEKL